MTIDPFQLLRKLEPAVRPVAAPSRIGRADTPFEHKSFDDLLSLVSTGMFGEGFPVQLGPDLQLSEPLEQTQLDRLAAAADVAARAGAKRAVMLVDGRSLVLDVEQRELTAELGGTDEHDVIEIDAAVYVAGTGGAERRTSAPPAPGNGVIPPGIAKHFTSAVRAIETTHPAGRRAG